MRVISYPKSLSVKATLFFIILYINILVLGCSGVCVGVCGCAIPRWNRLGTHMNARPPDKRPRAPHARNRRKCVFYYIRHNVFAVFRARTPVCGCTIPQWNRLKRPRAPAISKNVFFYYIKHDFYAIFRAWTHVAQPSRPPHERTPAARCSLLTT